MKKLEDLAATIKAEPVEDGMSHPGERIVDEILIDEADDFTKAFLHVTPSSLQASILRLVGRALVEDPAVRQRIVKEGLQSGDVQVRDAAVQAVESWEDVDCIEELRQHKEPKIWLANYIHDVINEFGGAFNKKSGFYNFPGKTGKPPLYCYTNPRRKKWKAKKLIPQFWHLRINGPLGPSTRMVTISVI